MNTSKQTLLRVEFYRPESDISSRGVRYFKNITGATLGWPDVAAFLKEVKIPVPVANPSWKWIVRPASMPVVKVLRARKSSTRNYIDPVRVQS